MPKRTKEQLLVEIKNLVGEISWSVTRSQRDGLEISWIGTAKRRAQELAVECQRLEDLMDEGIEEAVQQLRKGLEDE
jgi:adenine-specific DNA methylase